MDQLTGYDGVREAAFFFRESTPPDDATQDAFDPVPADRAIEDSPSDNGTGKTDIRIHHSPRCRNNRGATSAGCLVSPSYPGLRRLLIQWNSDERDALSMGDDDDLEEVLRETETFTQAEDAYGRRGRRRVDGWANKIAGTFWLIRPDQRPVAD
jgi:hypothetical protein